ncbi:MAG: mercury methylation corrinoid protein HgcA, partial [Desulfuromonadales bacterium]
MAQAPQACCPPAEEEPSSCCSPAETPEELPGYRLWPFLRGWTEAAGKQVPQVATDLTFSDIAGRWAMRWGIGRSRFRVTPGLYAVGNPGPESPVLVSANYKMSFDALRRELSALDAWVLVLDTRGINVWCAAGKGTFGTGEIVRRVGEANLAGVVSHRTLILPQLGAPGVAAHEVARQCGFKVVYGPVRARDIEAFLSAGMKATPEMRRVSFSTRERLVLTPVELTGMGKTLLRAALVLFLLGGIGRSIFSPAAAWSRGGGAVAAGLSAVLAGAVLTPVLLPWIPGRAFSLKGALTGAVVATTIVLARWHSLDLWNGTALFLAIPAVASWCAMNFT